MSSHLTPDPIALSIGLLLLLDQGSSLVKYSIYCIALNRIPRSHFRTLDPRSNYYKFRLLQVYAIGSGLKFYNLHQTLNTSINALNSFTDIYLISSAKFGFVFLISFTSFFLIVICLHHILSGTSCQACCLVLVAWSGSPVLPLSSIGNLRESKTRNPIRSLSHDNYLTLVKHLVSLPFLTCWFHQSPVTKKPVRLRLYFCLLDPRSQQVPYAMGSELKFGQVPASYCSLEHLTPEPTPSRMQGVPNSVSSGLKYRSTI